MSIGGLAIFGLIMLFTSAIERPRPWFVWNVTPSVPPGLYAVSSPNVVEPGDMVVARLPESWQRFAAQRRYLASRVPVLKRVAAVAGSTVCASAGMVTIDGRLIFERRQRDGQGRPLPWWQGCRRLRAGQAFLLGQAGPASFDSRYIGAIDHRFIIGRAAKIWPR